MRILIDARMTHNGGVYSYTNALLESVLELDASRNEYFVLYNKGQGQVQADKARNLVAPSGNPFFWIFWDYWFLPGIVERLDIDIFHSFKRPSLRRIRTKKAMTIHSGYHFLFPELRSMGEKLYLDHAMKKSAGSADTVISVSFADATNVASAYKVPRDKIAITQLAPHSRFRRIDTPNELMRVKSKLGLPDRFIVYVGSVYPVKNVPTIVKVYHELLKRGVQDLGLVIVGQEGWGMKSVREIMRKLGVQDQVLFTGHQDSSDLPHIYTLADLLLFPSYYEAFCAPPLEAMACGTPVVASTSGGVPEVVGDAGLLNDPDDVGGLADSCMRILTDTDFRDELVQRGYKRAASFSWEKCATETVSVYDSMHRKSQDDSRRSRPEARDRREALPSA